MMCKCVSVNPNNMGGSHRPTPQESLALLRIRERLSRNRIIDWQELARFLDDTGDHRLASAARWRAVPDLLRP